MVYRGKPSLGCGTCRNRHVKCDQTRPVCLVCQRSGRQCLGYRDWAELYVRDQTEEVTSTRDVARRRDSRSFDVSRMQSRFLAAASQQPPPSLTPSREQLALGHFYTTFVRPIELHAPKRSYFQVLPTVFLAGQPGSTLEAATLSLAYATFHAVARRDDCIQEARANYQLALNRLQEAIISPSEATSNDTLLTVLLMQAIEVFAVSDNAASQAGSHTDGAVALIKLRGREGFQDSTSKKLLASARGSAIMRGFKQFLSGSGSFSDFPVRSNLGVAFLDDDDSIDRTEEAENLVPILPMSQVPRLCDEARDLLGRHRGEETILAVRNLVSRCHEVDASLIIWSHNSPQPFFDQTMAMSNKEASIGYDDYSESSSWGRVDSYRDIFVARSWNEYRIARLFVHDTLMRCHKWLAEDMEHEDTDEDEVSYATSEWVSHDMIDGICASVPFLLRRPPDPENGLGSYFLFAPLLFAQSTPITEVEQREWLAIQLFDVVKTIGIQESRIGTIVRQKVESLREARQRNSPQRFMAT